MSTEGKAHPNRRVFFSYAAEDAALANQVMMLLSSHPRARLLTTEALSAGEDWPTRLQEYLQQSDVFLLLLSQNSLNSSWVLLELGTAWSLGVPIVPITTQPGLVERLPIEQAEVRALSFKELKKPGALDAILSRYEAAA